MGCGPVQVVLAGGVMVTVGGAALSVRSASRASGLLLWIWMRAVAAG